jgi:myo-inositol-1(or 4)-monophosphatase
MPPTDVRPEGLLELAVDAATAAGQLLLDGLGRARSLVETKTTVTDMVTEMDHRSERLIVDTVLRARPHDAFIGEETGAREGSTGVRWVVDPLDGTTNYLYGHPGFAVSIAAEIDGVVVAGAVFDPVHDELFTAVYGEGAHCNGEPITHSGKTEPATALLATGFAYDPAWRHQQAETLVHLLPRVRDIRRMGAAAVDLCSVACGRVDAYYERGLAEWDLAAGGLIAVEAGAMVGGIDGGPARAGESILAAPPELYEALRALITASERADRSIR